MLSMRWFAARRTSKAPKPAPPEIETPVIVDPPTWRGNWRGLWRVLCWGGAAAAAFPPWSW